MTNSARSSFEPVPGAAAPSTAYELYHRRVQRWIYDTGWERLRDAQERAAAPILTGDRDVIIAAATASGKTEAAWLPICSALVRQREAGEARPGVQALFISPLKALINDQYDRMTRLCDRLDIPVHRWHGDVAASRKSLVMRAPNGVLLITPESIEAMLVNHGDRIGRVLGDLRYAVIDELHSFVGTERGAQLQSLLDRVELCVRRGVPRIALSATLGDFTAAAEFLRPGKGSSVQVVCSADDAGEIRLQLRGYRTGAPPRTGSPNTGLPPGNPPGRSGTDPGYNVETLDIAPIADHLFLPPPARQPDFASSGRGRDADMLNRRHHRDLHAVPRSPWQPRQRDPRIRRGTAEGRFDPGHRYLYVHSGNGDRCWQRPLDRPDRRSTDRLKSPPAPRPLRTARGPTSRDPHLRLRMRAERSHAAIRRPARRTVPDHRHGRGPARLLVRASVPGAPPRSSSRFCLSAQHGASIAGSIGPLRQPVRHVRKSTFAILRTWAATI
jgi:hypothetical protein